MKIRPFLLIGIFLMAVGLWLTTTALAAPSLQVQTYATPTPGPDGRIIYTVQAGDDCTRISLLTGVSMDFIRQTNRLDENCTIIEGQELVIGVGSPAVASSTPGPASTPILPTPTPSSGGAAEVCVALYNDANGDGLRQANTDALGNYLPDGTEPIVEGGAISLTSLAGPFSQTLNTVAGYDPICFTNVPEGKFTVSAAVPDGYNPTTVLSFDLEVKPGDSIDVSFGAQSKSQPATGGGGRSALLGIFGALLLLTGVGLGVYAWRLRFKK